MFFKLCHTAICGSIFFINLVMLTACGVMGEPVPYTQTEGYLQAQKNEAGKNTSATHTDSETAPPGDSSGKNAPSDE
jgi:hypothetical protein